MTEIVEQLQAIHTYEMTPDQAKAYKIALMYCSMTAEMFPGERTVKMAAGKDPRKSGLFRYCLKLVMETRNIIPDNEYILYIRAQLEILKQINDGKIHAMITPQCLVGPKAWVRWEMWKRRYDKVASKPMHADDAGITMNDSRVLEDVKATLRFLRQHGGCHIDWLVAKLESGDMKRWISNAAITPYFLAYHRGLRERCPEFAKYGLSIDAYLSVDNPTLESRCWQVISEETV